MEDPHGTDVDVKNLSLSIEEKVNFEPVLGREALSKSLPLLDRQFTEEELSKAIDRKVSNRDQLTKRSAKSRISQERERLNAYFFLCRQEEVKKWLSEVFGYELRRDLVDEIKDGRMMCLLVNQIQSGLIPRIHAKTSTAFYSMENITFFCRALKELGILDLQIFSAIDLYEEKNIPKVVYGLLLLEDNAKRRGFKFAIRKLDVAIDFSEEQIQKAINDLTKNKGSGEMMNFSEEAVNQLKLKQRESETAPVVQSPPRPRSVSLVQREQDQLRKFQEDYDALSQLQNEQKKDFDLRLQKVKEEEERIKKEELKNQDQLKNMQNQSKLEIEMNQKRLLEDLEKIRKQDMMNFEAEKIKLELQRSYQELSRLQFEEDQERMKQEILNQMKLERMQLETEMKQKRLEREAEEKLQRENLEKLKIEELKSIENEKMRLEQMKLEQQKLIQDKEAFLEQQKK